MQHVVNRFMVVLLVLLMAGVALSLAPSEAKAHGTECYNASYFENIQAGGSGHWRAVANVQAPVPSIGFWHAHGPWGLGAEFWANSVSETYGKAYIYFSWPDSVNPAWFYSPSDFQACVN